ncbi:MAG: valine--tRNA ligase, partial [bacterium]
MKRSEFIKLCLKESTEAEKTFENLWKNLGLSIDWTKLYTTIDEKSRRISQQSFIELYKKNKVYKKDEPSLYCTTCQTSVAQAEIDNKEIKSTFNDIEFKTEDGEQLIIATTRPELIPACVAVFYHPDDKRYKKLKGKHAITPIFNKKVPILPDDKVDPEKGSGIVMCCTFGDQTDIYWFKKHKLPFIQAVGLDGKWTKITEPLEGLRAHEARKKMLELLQQEGLLLGQKEITHFVNTHERCKQEIEYQILHQWFIKILEHKNEFLKQGEKVNWYPEFMKARYIDWVKNLSWDWCISRQRFFGIPFPVWYCSDCGEILLADEKDLPVDPQEQQYPGKKCTKCSSKNITPDTDVMDTWNTSSLTPQINVNWPINDQGIKIPMSLRPQAHDIIRTWAFYTIVKAYFHEKQIPWNDIVISGHVLSGKEKISKSHGGAKLTPEHLLSSYPADVIRYWSANGKIGTDTAFSENQLKIGQRLLTKIWNAFRFSSEHIKNYNKNENVELDDLSKWILHKFAVTFKTYRKYFDNYEHTQALETIEKFFWHNFCDNYLELIKDQIFNPDKYDNAQIESTKFTLYEIGFGILQLFTPFLPHITEAIYQMLFKKNEKAISINNTILNSDRFNFEFSKENELIDKIIEIVGEVRKLKSETKLSLKSEIQQLNINSEN